MILARDIYFEKQGILNNKCGLHALNNLVGSNLFKQQQLNHICSQLQVQYNSNYKHFLGGDYDANVLITALNKYQYKYTWLNNTKKEEYFSSLQLQNKYRLGFILNRSKKNNFFTSMLGFSDRHWIAVRKINEKFYILDSKESQNKYAEAVIDLPMFLRVEMQKESHIIQIFAKQWQQVINQ